MIKFQKLIVHAAFYNYQQYYIVFCIIIAKICYKTVGITLKKKISLEESLEEINIQQFLIHRFKRKDYFPERKEYHR